jgi:hypothetical protein
MLIAFEPKYTEESLVSKSSRPTYAIILLLLSAFWMCAVFLPFLYSVVSPNGDLKRIVSALEERGAAPPEAMEIVQQTIAAVGPLTRVIPIAYYSEATATVRLGKSHTSSKKQASYIAWFQKSPKPLAILITRYEDDGGQKTYGINEGEPMSLIRGYAIPILLFGLSLFLARKRATPTSAR